MEYSLRKEFAPSGNNSFSFRVLALLWEGIQTRETNSLILEWSPCIKISKNFQCRVIFLCGVSIHLNSELRPRPICSEPSYSHFCSKNINVFENTLDTTVVINVLVQLPMLWITGPKSSKKYIMTSVISKDIDQPVSFVGICWSDCMDRQAGLWLCWSNTSLPPVHL